MTGGQKRSPSNDDVKPDVKRIKSEPVKWQWEDDGNVWSDFSQKLITEIDTAFKNGLQKIKVDINDVKFDILFERMVQRNSTTFWERRIRATNQDDDGGLSGTYEFEDDNGNWTRYNHSIQRLVHAGNIYKLKKVFYTFRKQNYNIDLRTMTQINTKTNKTRTIRHGNENSNINKVDTQISSNGTAPAAASKSNQRVRSSRSRVKIEDDEDDEEEERVVPKRSTGAKKSDNEENAVVKTFSFKGKAPVDVECFAREKYLVYYEGANIYDAMLNQTNLKNNNNKFYLMQLLQNNTTKGYAVWFRWGRVGMTGQSNLTNYGNNLEEAKEVFCKKFFDKTKNEFSDRKSFKKVQGKYDLLFMDYKSTKTDETDGIPKKKTDKKVPDSKLEKKIQTLVELLCNIKEMEEAVIEMKYDTKKAPLGKLTKEQIKAGYKALQKIDHCITNKDTRDSLIKACDAFYTRVPHCFGMQRPPVIRTKKELKLKIELLETLGDIEIAMKVMNEESDKLLNPIDQHYMGLNCKLNTLDHKSEEFELIGRYTQNTHAKTHNQYKMEVTDVFEITHSPHYENFKDVGNRTLLWHGSRLTNWVGILSQGLRIAPPEAPVTGYMFGKGIYFADMSSKSANYCYPTRTKNTGFALLCEVSLGNAHELLAADYEADRLPSGYHSTKGLGKFAPSEKDNVTLSDGTMVPLGVPCDTGVANPGGYTLNYNEYVVYNTKQIRARYLVQLKFIFK